VGGENGLNRATGRVVETTDKGANLDVIGSCKDGGSWSSRTAAGKGHSSNVQEIVRGRSKSTTRNGQKRLDRGSNGSRGNAKGDGQGRRSQATRGKPSGIKRETGINKMKASSNVPGTRRPLLKKTQGTIRKSCRGKKGRDRTWPGT